MNVTVCIKPICRGSCIGSIRYVISSWGYKDTAALIPTAVDILLKRSERAYAKKLVQYNVEDKDVDMIIRIYSILSGFKNLLNNTIKYRVL